MLFRSNNQDYPVTLNSIDGGNWTGSTACPAENVSIASVSDLADDIAVGQTTTQDLTVSMDEDAPEGCAGLSFDVPLTANLSSDSGN